jgi:transketolase
MRNKFSDKIFKLAKNDKSICVIVADISPGGSMLEFQKKFSERFINCGVAEQTMIGLGSGLAMRGFKPFCYSISTFALFRPYEFVRVDICYQNLPVVIVGMGAGVTYSTLGGTHQSIEDVALATSLPNMQVICPCDPDEMSAATEWCVKKNNGPVYLRLGKVGEPNLTKNSVDNFEFGKVRYLKKGKDACIISYGPILKNAFTISNFLKKNNISSSIISFHTIKPFDKLGLIRLLKKYKKILVFEEHIENGGLSQKIKSIANEIEYKNKILSFTLKDKFFHFYGSHEELLEKHGLDFKIIAKKFLDEIKKK